MPDPDWIELPNGDLVRRSTLRPCGGCGGTAFRVAGGAIASRRVYCPRCVKPKAGERPMGTLDARTGKVEVGREG